jgi:hypothetical protein
VKKIINKNLLIECTSEKEAFEVLNCLKSLGERTDETYFHYGDSWKYVGFYEGSDKWTIANFSVSFGSKIIQASDFLKEHSKKECPFIPGQWYKLSSGTSFVDRDWWIKFKEIDHNRGVLSEEYITNETLFKGGFFGSIESYTYTPIDVNEIQEFLPERHPDKLSQKKLTEQDLIPGEIYVYDNDWISVYPTGPVYYPAVNAYNKNEKWNWVLDIRHATAEEKELLQSRIDKEATLIKKEPIKNVSGSTESLRDVYIEVNSQEEANHVFDKLESLGEPVKRYLLIYVAGEWNKIQYDNHHKGWICYNLITKKRMCAKDFLKDWKTESKNPVAVVKNKPLIEPVHSISVSLSTKKKTNKFKI